MGTEWEGRRNVSTKDGKEVWISGRGVEWIFGWVDKEARGNGRIERKNERGRIWWVEWRKGIEIPGTETNMGRIGNKCIVERVLLGEQVEVPAIEVPATSKATDRFKGRLTGRFTGRSTGRLPSMALSRLASRLTERQR
jgi:hypothetical protein